MSEAFSLTLCVQLWPQPGQEAALIQFEDQVLALIPRHGGTVLQRVRRVDDGEEAFETHVITFPDQSAFESYMHDPERLALLAVREIAIARTVSTPVVLVR
ncbi:MAG: hypothetical protein Q8M73_08945 [Actinomycetota bacterium]|nr:hypothetical protein [Actinomycetota bacterium]